MGHVTRLGNPTHRENAWWTQGRWWVCGSLACVSEYPQLLHTVLDTTDPRGLAEFYRQLLGLRYREGDEPPSDGRVDDADWLVLVDSQAVRQLAFQHVDRLERTTWPRHEVPMQLHLDFTVSSLVELHRQRGIAEALGAELLLDRTGDPDEPLLVFADLSGHHFCTFVG
jgi:catechol 2,3-dioxygenase-like lactoylglutathione lyase family enzyme